MLIWTCFGLEAQLGIHFCEDVSEIDSPPRGTYLRTHYCWKKVRKLTGKNSGRKNPSTHWDLSPQTHDLEITRLVFYHCANQPIGFRFSIMFLPFQVRLLSEWRSLVQPRCPSTRSLGSNAGQPRPTRLPPSAGGSVSTSPPSAWARASTTRSRRCWKINFFGTPWTEFMTFCVF